MRSLRVLALLLALVIYHSAKTAMLSSRASQEIVNTADAHVLHRATAVVANRRTNVSPSLLLQSYCGRLLCTACARTLFQRVPKRLQERSIARYIRGTQRATLMRKAINLQFRSFQWMTMRVTVAGHVASNLRGTTRLF